MLIAKAKREIELIDEAKGNVKEMETRIVNRYNNVVQEIKAVNQVYSERFHFALQSPLRVVTDLDMI